MIFKIGIFFYRLSIFFGMPLIFCIFLFRIQVGKEDKKRINERLGKASIVRPDGKLIWIHAASVGESMSVLPLIKRLSEETNAYFLLTTGTLTSAQLLSNKLPPRTIHQYVPIDFKSCIEKFLEFWQPSIVFLLESEVWPNMILSLQSKKITHVMLNARMSNNSFNRWSFIKPIAEKLLGGFRLCLAQSRIDAERYRKLSNVEVVECGNLKFSASSLLIDEKTQYLLKKALVDRSVWLAASTHEGEESIVYSLHKRLSKEIPNLLTIIAPRHSHRGSKIYREMQRAGQLTIHRRSQGELPNSQTNIYLADTMGEMGLWYKISPIVFLGKSLVGQGGQNPIEPCMFRCAILCGMNMDNFSEIVEKLLESGAIIQVNSFEMLLEKLKILFNFPLEAEKMGLAGLKFALSQVSVIDRFVEILKPELISSNIDWKN